MRDLVILVPDKNYEIGIANFLRRYRALGISEIDFEIYVNPGRDPGCIKEGPEFLRQFQNDFEYALIMFDYIGSGKERIPVENIYKDVMKRLSHVGFEHRSDVVIIVPTVDIWFWSDSPEVASVLTWPGTMVELLSWMRQEKLITTSSIKPANPKAALERVLKELRKPRSSALYGELAGRIAVGRCEDPAYTAFKARLIEWFSATNNT